MLENAPQRARLHLPALLGIALLLGPAAPPVRAQEGQRVELGHIIPRVVSASDTSQAYALYIPAHYVASRSWPLLVIMDPRGRAVEALRPFRDAAERYGWIVMSGYGTTSDGPMAPNVSAVNAMIADASATFALDTHRIYLAGLSGTARLAWHFAAQLGGRVAGIYGAGAGGTVITRFTDPPKGLVFFGAAGDSDFNYDEVRALEPWLAQHAVPHRLRFFHGGHQWPPEAVASEGVDWFELKAMQQGLEPLRESFVDSLYQKDTTAAAALEAAGRGADALDRYEEIVADYGTRASAARAAVARLKADPAVEAALGRRRQERYAFEDFMGRLHGWVADLVQSDQPTSPESGIHILGLEDLEARLSAPDTTPPQVASVRRRLASAYVLLAFYQPQAFLKAGEPAKALVVLDVAKTIRDDDPAALVLRAEAQAELGKKDEALDALERAVSLGAAASSFADDPRLEKLQGEKRFRALVGGG